MIADTDKGLPVQVACYQSSCHSTTNLSCVCTENGFNDVAKCLESTCTVDSDYYSKFD